MGGESGPVGHTGTGCYKNHEHSLTLHPHGTANRLVPATGGQRRQSATTGALSIAAVTALLTSSPATNVSGIQHPPAAPPKNLVDLGIRISYKLRTDVRNYPATTGLLTSDQYQRF